MLAVVVIVVVATAAAATTTTAAAANAATVSVCRFSSPSCLSLFLFVLL